MANVPPTGIAPTGLAAQLSGFGGFLPLAVIVIVLIIIVVKKH
jgi:hypothetical protein